MIRLRLLGLAAALLLLGCGDPDPAPRAGPLGSELYRIDLGDTPEPGAFLRFAEPGPRGGGLDVAITDYEHPRGGPTVHLVGAVHVADPPYFEALQDALDDYELVLYEGVMAEDSTPSEWQARAREEAGSISSFQHELASWFGFVFQLEKLEYSRPHFRHADMTLEEFKEAGGEEFFRLTESADPERAWSNLPSGVRRTFEAVRAFGKHALSKPGPIRSLARRMFAETMGTRDIGTALDMMPGLSELVLRKRNDVVMRHLEAALPDATGSVAVFYGAAHMPDLEQRLSEKLGYRRKGGRWIRAWALRAPLER